MMLSYSLGTENNHIRMDVVSPQSCNALWSQACPVGIQATFATDIWKAAGTGTRTLSLPRVAMASDYKEAFPELAKRMASGVENHPSAVVSGRVDWGGVGLVHSIN